MSPMLPQSRCTLSLALKAQRGFLDDMPRGNGAEQRQGEAERKEISEAAMLEEMQCQLLHREGIEIHAVGEIAKPAEMWQDWQV